MGMTKSEAGKLGHRTARGKLVANQDRQHREAVARWEALGVACGHCGQPIPYEKRRNRFCSSSCSVAENNGKRVKRAPPCPICGKSIGDRRNSYCSRACSEEARYQENIRKWFDGEHPGGSWRGVAPFVRQWLARQRGERCWKCGWSEVHPRTGKVPLQVHHLSDPTTHRPEELELLCPNCHALTESFGALNKGNGRKERYDKP